MNTLRIGEQIHQSRFKDAGEGTFLGEYDDRPVIVKRGGERLISEADTLRDINDDSVPKLLELRKGLDSNLLIMTKLEGVELPKMIELTSTWESRSLSIKEASHITLGVVLGFIAVRNAGRLYRDLNFNHVLVGDNGIGLCDHEADIIVDDQGRGLVESNIGTWETMSPEEFAVGEAMSEASNTYTLGVLLLQLVTGHNPFFIVGKEGATIEELRELAYKSHLQDLTIETGLAEVDQLLTKALAHRPEDRYQSLATFQEAVEALTKTT